MECEFVIQEPVDKNFDMNNQKKDERSSNLFRAEAISKHKNHWLGTSRLAIPAWHRVYAMLGIIVILAVIAILIFGRYIKHIEATGMLVPARGLLNLKSPITGKITVIFVKSGQHVNTQDQVFAITSGIENPAIGDIATAVDHSLRAEIDITNSELKSADSKKIVQEVGLRNRRDFLMAEVPQFNSQIAIQKQIVSSAQRILDEYSNVQGAGIVSDPEIQQQRLSVLSAQQQIANLRRQRLDTQSQLAQVEEQCRELPISSQNDKNAIRSKLQDLRQQLAKLSGSNLVVVRSPSSGEISALTCHVGDSVSAGESLASVTPKGSPLEAQILVSSEAIGFVRQNANVELHYTSFPYREFGAFTGTVESVSSSALTTSELDSLTGQHSDTPMYRVMVTLPSQSVDVQGHKVALQPGMQVTAEIAMNQLRLIEWIFEPLYDLTGRPVLGH